MKNIKMNKKFNIIYKGKYDYILGQKKIKNETIFFFKGKKMRLSL